MSKVRHIVTAPVRWLDSPGPFDGIVISSRIRLARNRAGTRFRRTLPIEDQQTLVDDLMTAVHRALPWPDDLRVQPSRLSDLERAALLERHLISREIAGGRHPSGLCLSDDHAVALLLNEEDHVRLQCFGAGLCLENCLERAIATDRSLESAVTWAVDPVHGHRTACHTNVGTGLRASVMLHLPALAETGELKAVLRALDKLHMTVRGILGEGSEATGHCYQVSNARTLGQDESTIVAGIHAAVLRLVEGERLARQSLADRNRVTLEDKVYRAWGLLTNARALTSDELNEHLSWIRLGLALRMLSMGDGGPTWSNLDRIFLTCQPAHLQILHEGAVDPAGRDRVRATLVRQWLRGA